MYMCMYMYLYVYTCTHIFYAHLTIISVALIFTIESRDILAHVLNYVRRMSIFIARGKISFVVIAPLSPLLSSRVLRFFYIAKPSDLRNCILLCDGLGKRVKMSSVICAL